MWTSLHMRLFYAKKGRAVCTHTFLSLTVFGKISAKRLYNLGFVDITFFFLMDIQ